jgi:uncharacterized protein YggT (Ycf19 family)
MLESSFHLVQQIIYSPLGEPGIVPPNSYVVICPSATFADPIAQFLLCLKLGWALVFTIFMSRFFLHVFRNINIFQNSFFGFIFRLSRPFNRLFMGLLPCIYGIDLGIFLTYSLFDLIDQFLNHIVIIDQLGIIYT